LPTPAEPAQKNVYIFLEHAQHALTVTQAAVTQTAAVMTEISNSKDERMAATT
jgi:hypothetical protein